MLGSYAFSLQGTIDHQGFPVYSGHYTVSVYGCEKTIYRNDDKIIVCDINHTRGLSTTYVTIYKLLVEWVYNQNTEYSKYFLPWCGLILSILLNTCRGIDTETS